MMIEYLKITSEETYFLTKYPEEINMTIDKEIEFLKDNLNSNTDIMIAAFIKNELVGDDIVVVSPDVGGVKRARSLAKWLHAPLAIIDKRRAKANVSEVMNIIGDVAGKKAILIDDMIDTAGTICNAAYALKEKGATEVFACATHAILSDPAVERLKAAPFNKVIVTDTIELPDNKRFENLEILSTDTMFSETIKRIVKDQAISDLFELPHE